MLGALQDSRSHVCEADATDSAATRATTVKRMANALSEGLAVLRAHCGTAEPDVSWQSQPENPRGIFAVLLALQPPPTQLP